MSCLENNAVTILVFDWIRPIGTITGPIDLTQKALAVFNASLVKPEEADAVLGPRIKVTDPEMDDRQQRVDRLKNMGYLVLVEPDHHEEFTHHFSNQGFQVLSVA